MQSDDLFLRKMRGPSSRPPLSPSAGAGGVPPSPPPSPGFGGTPALHRSSSSEAVLGGPPGGGGVSHRARTHSHEEVGGNPRGSPRFRDPFVLLGLGGNGGARDEKEEEGEGGDPDFFPRPLWSPHFAHYDVQSILFDPTEPLPDPPGPTSGASAAHLEPPETFGGPPPDPEALVLSCPRFCCETGGEMEAELGEGVPHGPPGPGYLPNAAVAVLEEPQIGGRPPYPIEYSDDGAYYYRKFFYGKEHQNLVGEDAELGPVAVSLRREEKGGPQPQILHRIIVRTRQLRTLRGSVLEEALPPKKLLEAALPRLRGLRGLRLAGPSPALHRTLLTLDEQAVSRQRKVGVLYCRGGQSSEEEMYNNESAGPAFAQFLALLGTRVRLRGFRHYRAQLDTRADTTGTHSLYTTYHGYEVMFHVSTMLPFTPRNPQQLLRKRHIGNDIVTIVFQEPGAKPFSPRALRSHFQHIFIVVRVHHPCSPHTHYSVAVMRPEDTPLFGPPLPSGRCFLGGSGLRDFLLAKAINGENAAALGGRLAAMAARTRHQYLRHLARAPLCTPHRRLPALGGRRRLGGHQPTPKTPPIVTTPGALVWGARATRGGREVGCLLGVAAERVVVVTPKVGVRFNCASRDVLGWAFAAEGRLEIFYGAGEALELRLPHGRDAAGVVERLQAVTRGCEARALALPRGAGGTLGFRVGAGGVVTEVTRFSFAEVAGLRPGCRLLRVAHRPLPTLSPRRLRALLRRPKVPLTLLPPDRHGRPRRR
ncbi:signal-induced proliferation-associated protein 1 [Cuculus canorus]|uniref:signal-induced proliferation-associated protein 1 n=1 Tax=Cuculus canorus TaxID=55661 RepID=UPI0023AB54B1|nr:signal-induced proliferation-associated protein 1 [Cuculus canorus]